MKTSMSVNNGNHTKICPKSSKSIDCCCAGLVDEIQLIKIQNSKYYKKVDQILKILRENVSLGASLIFDESQSDLINFSEKLSGQKSSGHKRNTVLPQSQFVITDDSKCSPSPQIENELDQSFSVNNYNYLQEESVSTLHNEPKSDEIICQFDPLFVDHEPKTFAEHKNDNTPEEIEYSTFRASRNYNQTNTTTIEKIVDIDDSNFQPEFVRNSQGGKTKGIFGRWKENFVYYVDTGKRIDVDEVEATIKRKWRLEKNQERTYICRIEHKCHKYFKSKTAVENHIFSLFFVIQCRDCDRKYNRIDSLSKHCLRECLKKVQSAEYQRPSKEFNLVENIKFNGKKNLLDCSFNTDDEELDSSPVVKILRLPDFLLNTDLPASNLDQIYSLLGKSVLDKNSVGIKSLYHGGETKTRKCSNETTINISPTNLKTRLRCKPKNDINRFDGKRNFQDGYLMENLRSIEVDVGDNSISFKDLNYKDDESVESNASEYEEAEESDELESNDDDPDYALDENNQSEAEKSNEMVSEDEIDEIYTKVKRKRRLPLLSSDDDNSHIESLISKKSPGTELSSQRHPNADSNQNERLRKWSEDEVEKEKKSMNNSTYKEPPSQLMDEPEFIISERDDCLIKLSDDEEEVVKDMGIMPANNLKIIEKEKKKCEQSFIQREDHFKDLLSQQQETNVRHNGLSLEVSLKNHAGDLRCFYFNFTKDGETLNAPLVSTNLKIHMSKESGATFDLGPGAYRCTCDDCSQQNVSKVGFVDQLLDHLLRQRQIQFQCFYCRKCFKQRNDLYNHIKNNHWTLGRVILKSYSFLSPQSSKFKLKKV